MIEENNVVQKKSKKKPIIITIIILIVIIGAGIGGYFGYQYYEENKTTGTDWGDTYYNYLKQASLDNDNKEDYGLKQNMENAKIEFVQIEDEESPVMLMTYEVEESQYVNIYKINEENQIDKVIYEEPTNVEFLYQIEDETYAWYIHTETDTEDTYVKVQKAIDNTNQTNKSNITIQKNAKTTQETVDGDTITLSKFDETFIKPEIEENSKIDFETSLKATDLRNKIESVVKEYKPQEELVTEEVKTSVQEKVTEIEEIKTSIETAKAEIEAQEEKKAEEDEEKDTENVSETTSGSQDNTDEETNKTTSEGLKIGNNTIKYGKYVGESGATGETLVINLDGTATLTDGTGKTTNYTYKVGKYNFSQDATPSYQDAIIFYEDSTISFGLYVASGKLWIDPCCYSYAGDN